MRISDWSSDVCSSDLPDSADSGNAISQSAKFDPDHFRPCGRDETISEHRSEKDRLGPPGFRARDHRSHDRRARYRDRSEEHTSELQSLMRISYAVFCLKKKKQQI